jgi:hypothetical protein
VYLSLERSCRSDLMNFIGIAMVPCISLSSQSLSRRRASRDEYLLIARIAAIIVFGTVILFWYGNCDLLGGLVYDKLVEHFNPDDDICIEGEVSLCLMPRCKMKAFVSVTDALDDDQVTAIINKQVNQSGFCNAEKSTVYCLRSHLSVQISYTRIILD